MCNVTHGFKFCTCETGEKSGSPLPEYKWQLTRYAGKIENGPVGSIIGPSADLGEGLTEEAILEVLNSGEAFDFAYQPAEDDSLNVSYKPGNSQFYGYSSFIFKSGSWTTGMNPPFVSKLEWIARGDVFKK